MEVRLFTLFSRLAQAKAENWTKTKDFHLSCNLTFLAASLVISRASRVELDKYESQRTARMLLIGLVQYQRVKNNKFKVYLLLLKFVLEHIDNSIEYCDLPFDKEYY